MARFGFLLLTAAASTVYGVIHAGTFQDPGKEHRPKFRYWLPDASVSPQVVAQDVSSIAAVGAGGLEFVPFYLYGLVADTTERPTDWSKFGYGTPEYKILFREALRAAERENVVMDFAIGANQGQGAPAEPMTEGLAVHLLLGNASAKGGGVFSGPVPPPLPLPEYIASGAGFMHHLEQFDTQVKVDVPGVGEFPFPGVQLDENSYIDLSDQVKGGNLEWTAPTGASEWRILSFWQHYTNQRSCAGGRNADTILGNGSWTVDHFSKAGAALTTSILDNHVVSDGEIASLLKRVGNYAWEDSMEILASIYWTPSLLDRFENMFNYSLVKYLPLLATASNTWNGILPTYAEVFLYGNYKSAGESVHNLHYRGALNAGYQEYLSHLIEWSHSHGLKYSAQPAYNLPLQMSSDIPLLDVPEGESLGFGESIDAYRQFTGPAHCAGQNIISTELGAVDSAAYTQTVPDLLFRAKRSWAGGFNMAVVHGYPYSGPYTATTWPGYTTFYYRFTEMWNPIQPCWEHMREAMEFMSRNTWALQQGVAKIDLAFYLFAVPWRPIVRFKSTKLHDLGFTYDYIGPDALLLPSATYNGSGLAADGPPYKALVLDREAILTVEASEALVNLAAAGMPVVIIGSGPTQAYPDTAANRHAIDAAMQTLRSLKTAQVIGSADDVPSALAAVGVLPRISMNCSSNPVYPVWRWSETDSTHYVFLYNDQLMAVDCNASLAVSGSFEPYIYDAWTGEEARLLTYTLGVSRMDIPVHLEANQTMLIALKPDSRQQPPKCTAVASSSLTVRRIKCLDTGKTMVALDGPGSLIMVDGSKHTFKVPGPRTTNITTWDISIEDWHASKDKYSVETNVTVHNFPASKLVPWSQLGAGMEAVAGVGRYTATFTAPRSKCTHAYRLGGLLSTGPVSHTARVLLDGVPMKPIDPVNPVVEISDFLVAGKTHNLVIEVTTPLFNRIKAAANETMIWGTTAASVQPLYASLPYEDNGLVGPVSIQWTSVVELN